MRRSFVLLAMVVMMTLGVLPAASAHVHGGTPLLDCGMANANAGGNGTNGTPADDINGGPIVGFIPRDTGNAPFAAGFGTGPGFGATNGHCPSR